jgi:protein-tyrosine phosphatase
MKPNYRNSKGFSHHFILPVLALFLVGSIGLYTMSQSNAASSYGKVVNLRDPSGSSDHMISGVLYRSAKLTNANSNDVKKLSKLLSGGLIIDLREKADRVVYPDKTIPGTSRKNIPATGTTNYTKFVDYASNRKAFGEALTAIANAQGRVLVHCTYGKDRTGWTVAMVMYAIGDSDSAVMKEYMKSKPYGEVREEWLKKGLKDARDKYGSISGYLTKGLGLSNSTLKTLKKKLQLKTRYTLQGPSYAVIQNMGRAGDWRRSFFVGVGRLI